MHCEITLTRPKNIREIPWLLQTCTMCGRQVRLRHRFDQGGLNLHAIFLFLFLSLPFNLVSSFFRVRRIIVMTIFTAVDIMGRLVCRRVEVTKRGLATILHLSLSFSLISFVHVLLFLPMYESRISSPRVRRVHGWGTAYTQKKCRRKSLPRCLLARPFVFIRTWVHVLFA